MLQKNNTNSNERGLISYNDLAIYKYAIIELLANTLDVSGKILERISKFINNAAK